MSKSQKHVAKINRMLIKQTSGAGCAEEMRRTLSRKTVIKDEK